MFHDDISLFLSERNGSNFCTENVDVCQNDGNGVIIFDNCQTVNKMLVWNK